MLMATRMTLRKVCASGGKSNLRVIWYPGRNQECRSLTETPWDAEQDYQALIDSGAYAVEELTMVPRALIPKPERRVEPGTFVPKVYHVPQRRLRSGKAHV